MTYPPPPKDDPPTPKPRKRTRNLILGAIGAIVVVAAAIDLSNDPAAEPDPAPAAGAVPDYRVINAETGDNRGSADLLMPGATVDQAQAAIRDYADQVPDLDVRDYAITVVHAADATTYVCDARWVADEEAAALYTGGDVTAEQWPALTMNCPNP